jgi:hypothetical protein
MPNTMIDSTAGLRAGVPAQTAPDSAPAQWHRGLTIMAAASLFIGTRNLWTNAIVHRPPVAAVVSVCYLAILVTAVLALIVRSGRVLRRVDLGVLVTAIALAVCSFILTHAPNDEGALTARATRNLLAGRPIYGVPWPGIFTTPHVGVTYTMSGGADYTYGYPPLSALLTGLVHLILPGAPLQTCASVVTFGALIAGTVTLWLLVPAAWRSAVTALCLGFGLLSGYAALGYPALVAMALLIPVIVRWPSIGGRGWLSRTDVVRAVCLGAACSAQQLPWFLTPFLLAGLFLVRRGHLPLGRSLTIVARFAGIAAATFIAINAYFIAQSRGAWLSGLLMPLRQHAVPHGQGLIGVSYYFVGGSGALDFYSYAAGALALTLLVSYVLFIRRLGPALAILPWFVFYLSIRSQDGYFLLMTPLWLASVATVPLADFRRAYVFAAVSRRRRITLSMAIAGALAVVTMAFATIAVVTPAPFRIEILRTQTGGAGHHGVWQIEARVRNVSDDPLTPHFALSTNQSMTRYWRLDSGPASLDPGATAVYELSARTRGYVLDPATTNRLRIVTDTPMTLSSATLPAAG